MKKIIYFSIILALLATLAMAQSVSPSGAFTYSVPIEVPSGTGGIQPNLSLNYNSQGGNGFLGMGWSLGGLSVITRDTSYDVTWNDSTDHFVYNGQKLIPDVNNPVGSDYIYYTENYNGQRIRAFWNASFIETWEVTQKDGTRLIYGKIDVNDAVDSDGYIAAVNKNGAARLWALRQVIDVNGNYYLVSYGEDTTNGDYYPLSIVYTFNASGMGAYKAVIFTRELRSDHGIKYIPSKVDMDKRMDSIEVKIGTDANGTGGNLVRRYELDYLETPVTDTSYLDTLQELDSNGIPSKPPQRFDWDYTDNNFSSIEDVYLEDWDYSNPNGSDLFFNMDMNGDGKSDLVEIYKKDTKTYGRFWISDGIQLIKSGDDKYMEGWSSDPDNPDKFFAMDVNGDNKTDIIEIYKSGSSAIVRPWISTGIDFERQLDNQYFEEWGPDSTDPEADKLIPMDLNGDGKTDILEIYKSGTKAIYKFWISTPTGFSHDGVAYNYSLEGWGLTDPDYVKKYFPMDINGDGKTDLVEIYKSGTSAIVRYWISNGVRFIRPIDDHGFEGWGPAGYYADRFFSMDVNGDGKSDIVEIYNDPSSNHAVSRMWISNGSRFIRPYDDEFFEGWSSMDSPLDKLYPIDVNGDGKTDLLEIYYNENWNSAEARAWISDGTKFINAYSIQSFGGWLNNTSTNAFNFFLQDINGDGLGDIVEASYLAPDSFPDTKREYHIRSYLSHREISSRIHTIHNGQGAQINIDYTPAPQVNNQSGLPDAPYTSAIEPSQSSYPNIADKSPRYLATKVTINDGLNNTTSTSYEYYNGKTLTGLKQDRQSLGFQYTKTINPDGSYVVTEYYQEDRLELAGSPKKRSTYDADDKLYTEQEWHYYKYDPINDTFDYLTKQIASDNYKSVKYLWLSEVYQRNYNGGETYIESKTSYENYDSLNNPATIIQQSDTSDSTTIIKTTTDYGHNYNNWITRPYSQIIESADFDGQVEKAKKTFYFYDNENHSSNWTKGKLTQTSEFFNQYGYVNKFMTYDPYGNLETITDPKGNTSSTITYDSTYHMYPVSQTNAKGQTESFQYDDYMRPVITIGYNGAGTSTVYDSFGRVIGTYAGEDTDGDKIFNTLTQIAGTDYIDAVLIPETGLIDQNAQGEYPNCHGLKTIISKTYTDTGAPIDTYAYYDGLGRILQQKTISANDQWTTIDYYYDEKGREKAVTIPYFSNSYSYDRPELTDPPAHPLKTVEYDSIGRVVKNINSDSTFSQNIYGLSKTWYVDENDHVSMQEIDGRKILNHIYSNKYDSAIGTSNLTWARTTITEKARSGSHIIDIYKDDQDNTIQRTAVETTTDMLGRTLTQDDQSLGKWSYQYDANSNLIVRTDAIGQILSFTYDELNRLTGKYYGQIDQAAPDASQLRAAYYYDGDGSTDILLEHGYCKGLLTRVETYENEKVFYVVSYKYDQLGRVVQISKKIAKSTDVETVEYVEATQTIAYDRANRITQVTYPGGEIVTYSYDAGGQLVSVIGNRNGETINYGTNMTYTALGKMKSLLQGNGVTTNYGYYDESGLSDPANDNTDINLQNTYRLESINITKGSTIIANTHYEYDRLDNILKKTYQGANGDMEESFSYDHQNRLAHAEQSKGRYNYDYAYSEDNNINSIISHESADNNSIMGDSQRFYVYDAPAGDSGRFLAHAVKEIREGSATGQILSSYTYDKNGNMTGSTQYTTIEIKAKAAMSNILDPAPIMMLHINGKKPIEWKITNLNDFHTYRWVGYWNGEDTIDVVYKNGDDTPDSSLVIDSITVNGTTIQAENPAVIYDKGPWIVDAPDGNDTQPGTETLNVEGALRFTTAVTAGAEPQIRQLTFDEENRLVNLIDSSNHNNFYYNEGEERIKKTDLLTNSSTYYFFDNYEEAWEDGVGGVKKEAVSYYFANNLRLAQRTVDHSGETPQDQLLYNHTDHLGSAVVLTNEQGNVVYAIAYDPYGRTYYTFGVDEPTHKYTDQEKDASGLYYYGARYYDPEIGRFISPDSVLDGLNRYAYCGNNPINYIDPTGHGTEEAYGEHQRKQWEARQEKDNKDNGSGLTGGEGSGDSPSEKEEPGPTPTPEPTPAPPSSTTAPPVDTGDNSENPINDPYYAGGKWVDLGNGWRVRPDTNNPNAKPHIHVEKDGKEVWNQDEDGNPHHKRRIKIDGPNKKLKKKIKDKTGWDVDNPKAEDSAKTIIAAAGASAIITKVIESIEKKIAPLASVLLIVPEPLLQKAIEQAGGGYRFEGSNIY